MSGAGVRGREPVCFAILIGGQDSAAPISFGCGPRAQVLEGHVFRQPGY